MEEAQRALCEGTGSTLSGAFLLSTEHVDVMLLGQGMGFGNLKKSRWCSVDQTSSEY